jgi:hypothetical protein
LPELISIDEAHASHRDKFQILALHDKNAKSFAELDPKLAKIKAAYWQNKDLPFPVLLDSTGTTEKAYGIRGYPTGVLIDPQGKLVGEVTHADLEAKLPALLASEKWMRHRDMQKHVMWSFEPAAYSLNKLADILKRWTQCPVSLDAGAVQASGLSPDGPLPGVVVGTPITLRSIEELLLEPHGLGVSPSADDTQLMITRRSPKIEPQSYLQKLRNAELRGRLDGAKIADVPADQAPLSIKSLPLTEALKLVGKDFDLPIALDAAAMRTKTINPQTLVSGEIRGTALRQSLTKMLAPIGLGFDVCHEVVFITPKAK